MRMLYLILVLSICCALQGMVTINPASASKDTSSLESKFFEAVSKNNEVLAEVVFKQGIDKECRRNGFSPLHFAAQNKSHAMITLLVDTLGFDINGQDADGHTALDHLVDKNDLEVVQFLCGKGASPVVVDKKGATSLHKAARIGNVALMEFLVSKIQKNVKKRELDRVDTFGLTPYLRAVEHNAIDVARFLKQHGARIDVCLPEGATVLHIAAMKNYRTMMRYLLDEEGIDPEKNMDFGSPCLATAIKYDSAEVVEELLTRPVARILSIGKYKYPLIHYAALVNALRVTKLFLDKDIYSGNEKMQCDSHDHLLTPNDLAVMNSNWSICTLLQNKGVDTTSHQKLMGCVIECVIQKN